MLTRSGIARISLSGATENSCRVSARVELLSTLLPDPGLTASGSVEDGEAVLVNVPVPSDSGDLSVRLDWDGNWGSYPTNDIDITVGAFGVPFFVGFTLDSPEILSIPRAFIDFFSLTSIEVVIDGFKVNSGTDNWKLRVTEEDGDILPGTIATP